MKKPVLALLLIGLTISILSSNVRAQDNAALKSSITCGDPKRGTPIHERYQNLDAVGLFVSDTGDAMKAVPLQTEKVIEVFSKRIREQVFPYLNANADCQIPDLSVFKIGSWRDEMFVDEFMKQPRRLLIVVQIRMERLEIPKVKVGPWVALLTLQYIKSDSQPVNYDDGIRDSRQLIIQLSDPDDEIAKRLGWFASNVIVTDNKQVSVCGIPITEEKRQEILKSMPQPAMIPIPDKRGKW
jgi:hypothetical protein